MQHLLAKEIISDEDIDTLLLDMVGRRTYKNCWERRLVLKITLGW
jgi:hypothetical protein